MLAVRPLALVLVMSACAGAKRAPQKSDDGEGARAGRLSAVQREKSALAGIRPARRCFVQDSSASPERSLDELLDRAADRYDANDYEAALVCADEAARQAPRSVEAH